jgi:p21-activated kinase 1
MDETRNKTATTARRLTKRERQPPPVAFNNKTSTLKRAPSAASYFTPTNQFTSTNRLPPADAGAPFQVIVEEALHHASHSHDNDYPPASTTTTTTRRPPGPPHSHTADQLARLKPSLRQSASFNSSLARNKMDTPPSGTKSPRNRYSDDVETARKRKSDGGKKKGTFSTFMSSMLGSPRRPTISTPTNPMHVTHVSIDNETGEYTVRGTLVHRLSPFSPASWPPPSIIAASGSATTR